MQIEKRDGTIVDYDVSKIKNAITKANNATEEDDRISDEDIENITTIIDNILQELNKERTEPITVEEIQDYVEYNLTTYGTFEVAKNYITYRFKRALERKENTIDKDVLSLLNLEESDISQENSNKNAKVASTQRDLIAGEVSKDISKKYLLSKETVEAHESGMIHFHDLDYFMQGIPNCCVVNLGDMLDNGTALNGKMIESPKSFQVACTVMTQIIAAVASGQYGGVSMNIYHLGKYLELSESKWRKFYSEKLENTEDIEKLTQATLQKELESGIQTVQYQINTLMTTNGQSPFVTLFLDLDPEKDPYHKYTAKIIEEIFKQRIQGIKNLKGVYVTPAFPKLIYVLHEHNNLTGGGYDYLTHLAAECTTKRMYPDYISAKKMKEYYGEVFPVMGCRSFLSPYKDKDGKTIYEGRFNQWVVSINLPQAALARKANWNTDEWEFFKELDRRLLFVKRALLERSNSLRKTRPTISPIHWMSGAISRKKENDSIVDLLEWGYSTLSLWYIWVYETARIVVGSSHTTAEGTAFAHKLMLHLRQTADAWRDETGLGFSLYGTPAESLCYRFAKIDKKKYGEVKDVTDKGYYTNSYHVDVREEIDAIQKLTFEAPFQKYSSGGCISYVEIPNLQKNPEAVEEMIKFIYDNIQYAEFNTKSDVCHRCGFTWEIKIKNQTQWYCPNCQNDNKEELTVIRRSCWYLGENFWNEGKTKEIWCRVLHVN